MFKNSIFSSKMAGIMISLMAFSAVSGCATLDEALGVAKMSPDESQVITHRPLVTPQVATLPQPGEGVDRTIVPEPVDKMAKIQKQLAEEKKRRVIHEGATPERIATVQAKNPKIDVRDYAAIKDQRSPEGGGTPQQTEKKSWWKIWE